ncbi:unnamed protein product, partial [Notodromas monacha]
MTSEQDAEVKTQEIMLEALRKNGAVDFRLPWKDLKGRNPMDDVNEQIDQWNPQLSGTGTHVDEVERDAEFELVKRSMEPLEGVEGIYKRITKAGTGEKAATNCLVTVDYTMFQAHSKEPIDSTYNQDSSFIFRLGTRTAVHMMNEIMLTMRPGERAWFFVEPSMAFESVETSKIFKRFAIEGSTKNQARSPGRMVSMISFIMWTAVLVPRRKMNEESWSIRRDKPMVLDVELVEVMDNAIARKLWDYSDAELREVPLDEVLKGVEELKAVANDFVNTEAVKAVYRYRCAINWLRIRMEESSSDDETRKQDMISLLQTNCTVALLKLRDQESTALQFAQDAVKSAKKGTGGRLSKAYFHLARAHAASHAWPEATAAVDLSLGLGKTTAGVLLKRDIVAASRKERDASAQMCRKMVAGAGGDGAGVSIRDCPPDVINVSPEFREYASTIIGRFVTNEKEWFLSLPDGLDMAQRAYIGEQVRKVDLETVKDKDGNIVMPNPMWPLRRQGPHKWLRWGATFVCLAQALVIAIVVVKACFDTEGGCHWYSFLDTAIHGHKFAKISAQQAKQEIVLLPGPKVISEEDEDSWRRLNGRNATLCSVQHSFDDASVCRQWKDFECQLCLIFSRIIEDACTCAKFMREACHPEQCRDGWTGPSCSFPSRLWPTTATAATQKDIRLSPRLRNIICAFAVRTDELELAELQVRSLAPYVELFIIASAFVTATAAHNAAVNNKDALLDRLRAGWMADVQDKILYVASDKSLSKTVAGRIGDLRSDDWVLFLEPGVVVSSDTVAALKMHTGLGDCVSGQFRRTAFNLGSSGDSETMAFAVTYDAFSKRLNYSFPGPFLNATRMTSSSSSSAVVVVPSGVVLGDLVGWRCSWCLGKDAMVNRVRLLTELAVNGDQGAAKQLRDMVEARETVMKSMAVSGGGPKSGGFVPDYAYKYPSKYGFLVGFGAPELWPKPVPVKSWAAPTNHLLPQTTKVSHLLTRSAHSPKMSPRAFRRPVRPDTRKSSGTAAAGDATAPPSADGPPSAPPPPLPPADEPLMLRAHPLRRRWHQYGCPSPCSAPKATAKRKLQRRQNAKEQKGNSTQQSQLSELLLQPSNINPIPPTKKR